MRTSVAGLGVGCIAGHGQRRRLREGIVCRRASFAGLWADHCLRIAASRAWQQPIQLASPPPPPPPPYYPRERPRESRGPSPRVWARECRTALEKPAGRPPGPSFRESGGARPARPCEDVRVGDGIGGLIAMCLRLVPARRCHSWLPHRMVAPPAGPGQTVMTWLPHRMVAPPDGCPTGGPGADCNDLMLTASATP